ncbi:hypothetical protein ACL1C9_13215, partial [Corynebacterium striatum]
MSVSSVDPDLHDINLHIKPGKTRAPFFRYFRFNLPRLTRGLLCVVIAIPGAVAAAFAQSDIFIFEGQNAVFYLLAAVSAIFVVLGLCSAWRLWCQMRVLGTGVPETRYCRVPGSWYRGRGGGGGPGGWGFVG